MVWDDGAAAPIEVVERMRKGLSGREQAYIGDPGFAPGLIQGLRLQKVQHFCG
jgi:hypothetical protein